MQDESRPYKSFHVGQTVIYVRGELIALVRSGYSLQAQANGYEIATTAGNRHTDQLRVGPDQRDPQNREIPNELQSGHRNTASVHPIWKAGQGTPKVSEL